MLVFSGFLVLFKHMPVFMLYVSDFSVHKYSLEGLVVSIYSANRTDIRWFEALNMNVIQKLIFNYFSPHDVMYCHYNKSEVILKELGMENSTFELSIIKIISQLLLFKILSFFTLRRRLRKG